MKSRILEFKDSKIAWIGQIPKHWEVMRNKYVFMHKKEIVGSNFKNFDILSLTKNGIKTITESEQKGKVPDSFETYQIVKKDDIVMCLFDLDVSAVFSGVSKYNGIISPAYKIFNPKENLNFKYAGYFFDFVFADRKFKQYSKNIRFTLGTDEFMNLRIPLPPLDEQEKIAEFLDKKCEIIDKRLENLEQKISALKEYKKSLISECVTKGLNSRILEFKDSKIPWIGKIPKHWEISKIKYCFSIISGSGFEIKFQGFTNGDYPVAKASDISQAGKFLYLANNYISKEQQQMLGFKIIPKGSILMAKIGEALKKNNRSIAMVDCCLDNNCQGLVQKNMNINFSYFLFCCIDSQWFDNNGTIPCISNSKLLNFRIPYPPLDEQKEIAEFLDKKCANIDKLSANYQSQIHALKEYKKSLIYECVTGKKRD